MIIAVNISKTLVVDNRLGVTKEALLKAMEKAWSLNVDRCKKHEYVIGVVKGEIKGRFHLKSVFLTKDKQRVQFELEECSPEDEKKIKDCLDSHAVNLARIQRGKYI